MSRNPSTQIWRAALGIVAAVLAFGASMRAPLAQQGAAAGGPAHAATSGEGKAGGSDAIPIGLPARRPAGQDINVQAPHFVKMAPAKERALPPAAPNIVERNAIGLPVARRNAPPIAPLPGPIAVRAPVPPSAGGSSSGIRGGEIMPVRVPVAQPLASNRSTIGGAGLARPATALMPLGGPAKPGATSINGTSIRPKH